jgi:hypothetical protein
LLGETFEYKSVGKDSLNGVQTDLYTFKCLFKQHYILEVEHHKNDIYIIKFFQKNHTDSRYRYSLLNKKSIRKGSNGAKNFLTILNTVIKVVLDTYTENKKSSFGFMGAPTKDEMNIKLNPERVNVDGTVLNTKRYNTYGVFVNRYFSPIIFDHIQIESSSCYLIKSKESSLTLKDVQKFFEKYIEDFC